MNRSLANTGGGGILVFLGAYFGFVCLIALWTDRCVDFWATHYRGEPVDINYWWSVLLSIVSPAALLFNVVSEICMAALA